MANAGIACASQTRLLSAIGQLEEQPSLTPYRFTRALGLTPEQANQRPATSAHLIAKNLLADTRLPAPTTIATDR
jgi:hypothetical protein